MKHVNKYLTSLALTAGFVSAPVMAEGLDAKNLYVGGGISENVVDSPFGGGSDDAFGYTLFAGYEFQNSYPLVKTSAEIGYSDTDDFDRVDDDINGLWVAGVIEKDLPEINDKFFVIGRAGLDFGDDDGLLLGAGAGFHLTPKLDLRGEYIAKDSSSVYQASVAVNF
ncbi:MAG: hypothetical protein CMI03_16465 [Oceanospirillaceae bacterium]|uniref:outer membrane beta-barrel protein n=1 Tax=unclassified Thalassolituus TaxID=2624967 RepID=UPI000C6B33BD|nr:MULTISPECIES: outer membrane beta-barrel protein [unclassified Thalassolituus]MAS24874.1 hypothetical protein [Oceanospirillaceae bacterium]MBL33405.1 hypothetical protein [Oceanospirillaceae bacterium]MBS54335.1 hypothetical protein [Oceanospirillaceae bacterium]|tara:strand:- start:1955 stop:2455 length:501 start_codon:yes stop_codon:yes gene_type:complete